MANEASTCSCSGGPLSTNSTERGMNDRIKRLRRQSLDTQPRIYIERARAGNGSLRRSTRARYPFRNSAPWPCSTSFSRKKTLHQPAMTS